MDSVCRTCMRIIDVNEAVVSINDTDLRDKLQVCLPELILDNVVDPKMCSTCSAALSLSFRFKGMCYEAEKTINSCIQHKTSDGGVKPLNKIELLTIGRRDMGDIVMGDAHNFVIAEEIEIESSVVNKDEYLEPLQMLSDVASQATKAVAHKNNLSFILNDPTDFTNNWDEEIKSVRIERDPKVSKKLISSHIKGTIEDVIASVCTDSHKGKLAEAETPKLPARVSTRRNTNPIKSVEESPKKQSPVKVVVETTPVIDVFEKFEVETESPKTGIKLGKPKRRVKFSPWSVNTRIKSTNRVRRGTPRNKFVHQTGEEELTDELSIVTTVLEPKLTDAPKELSGKTEAANKTPTKAQKKELPAAKAIQKKVLPSAQPKVIQTPTKVTQSKEVRATPTKVIQKKESPPTPTKVIQKKESPPVPPQTKKIQIKESPASKTKAVQKKESPVKAETKTTLKIAKPVAVVVSPHTLRKTAVMTMSVQDTNENLSSAVQKKDKINDLSKKSTKHESEVANRSARTPGKTSKVNESPKLLNKVVEQKTQSPKISNETKTIISKSEIINKKVIPKPIKTENKIDKVHGITKVIKAEVHHIETFHNKTELKSKKFNDINSLKSLSNNIDEKKNVIVTPFKRDLVIQLQKGLPIKNSPKPVENEINEAPLEKIKKHSKENSIEEKRKLKREKILVDVEPQTDTEENVEPLTDMQENSIEETKPKRRKILAQKNTKTKQSDVKKARLTPKTKTKIPVEVDPQTDTEENVELLTDMEENNIEEESKPKHHKILPQKNTKTKESDIKKALLTSKTKKIIPVVVEPLIYLEEEEEQPKPKRQKVLVKTQLKNIETKESDFEKTLLTPKNKKPKNEAKLKHDPKLSPIKPASEKAVPVKTPTKKSPKVVDDVVKAIEKLLETPEYQKLLQLQTKSEGTSIKTEIITQKLQQLEKFYKEHKENKIKTEVNIKTEPRSTTKRKVQEPESKKVSPKRTRRTKNSSRVTKALEDINLDLAEINDGVERQKQALAASRKQTTPEPEKLSPVSTVKRETLLSSPHSKSRDTPVSKTVKSTITVKQNVHEIVTIEEEEPSLLVEKKKPVKKRVSYAVRAIRRRQQIREAKAHGRIYYKRKEIDGRSFRKRQPLQTCDQCGKVFKYISHLNVHRRAHVLLKSFKCELCGKCFTLQRYLLSHTMLHFSAGNHQCLICEKYFSSWHVLKKHELTHTGERPFVCGICNRTFTQRINLEVHTRIHTGIKEFVCYICNSAFGQKVHLVAHIRSHTGEKPYVCDLCPKAYAKSNVLRDHKALHMRKPYMCDSCNTLFRDEQCLARHLKKYQKISPNAPKCPGKIYNCGICSRYFTSRFSRNRHMKVHVKDLIEGIATKF